MIDKKLSTGRKVKIKEMTVDDIDFCKDVVRVIFKDGNTNSVSGLNKQKTAWVRKGLGGGDFKAWKNPNGTVVPDHVIKQLTDIEKDELVVMIQEAQTMGEEDPSSSN